ncbi:hypothetical protein TNCV_4689631 [Trichonephila clavipes]|nr:hypothetical protein TNCV_4689631 [Trichonephila clavipes]
MIIFGKNRKKSDLSPQTKHGIAVCDTTPKLCNSPPLLPVTASNRSLSKRDSPLLPLFPTARGRKKECSSDTMMEGPTLPEKIFFAGKSAREIKLQYLDYRSPRVSAAAKWRYTPTRADPRVLAALIQTPNVPPPPENFSYFLNNS